MTIEQLKTDLNQAFLSGKPIKVFPLQKMKDQLVAMSLYQSQGDEAMASHCRDLAISYGKQAM